MGYYTNELLYLPGSRGNVYRKGATKRRKTRRLWPASKEVLLWVKLTSIQRSIDGSVHVGSPRVSVCPYESFVAVIARATSVNTVMIVLSPLYNIINLRNHYTRNILLACYFRLLNWSESYFGETLEIRFFKR